MSGIVAYARTAGIVLLALAAVGTVLLGWDAASISYHAAVGLLFLYVGSPGWDHGRSSDCGGLGRASGDRQGRGDPDLLVVADAVLAWSHRDHLLHIGLR